MFSTLSLFNEQPNLDIDPHYNPDDSAFTRAAVPRALHEIVDTVPIYSPCFNEDGTGLYLPTRETLQYVHFDVVNLSAVASGGLITTRKQSTTTPTTGATLATTTIPSSLLKPLLLSCGGVQITKVITSPDNPRRIAVMSLDDTVRVLDITPAAPIIPGASKYKLSTSSSDATTTSRTAATTTTNAGAKPITTQTITNYTVQFYGTYKTRGSPTAVSFFQQSKRIAIVDSFNIVYYYELALLPTTQPTAPTISPLFEMATALQQQTLGTTTPTHIAPFYATLYPQGAAAREEKLKPNLAPLNPAALLASLNAPTTITTKPGRGGGGGDVMDMMSFDSKSKVMPGGKGDDSLKYGGFNSKTQHTEYRTSQVSALLMNNLLDYNPFIATTTGWVAWFGHHTLVPLLAKQVTASAINCIASSTAVLSKALRDVVGEYHTTAAKLSRALRNNAAHPPGPASHNSIISDFGALRFDNPNNANPTTASVDQAIVRDVEAYANILTPIQHDKQLIALGCNDSSVILLHPNLQLHSTFHQHDQPIISTTFSPDGQYLASISLDLSTVCDSRDYNSHSVKGALVITHVASGAVVYKLHNAGVTSFTWNPQYPCAVYTQIVNFVPERGDKGGRQKVDREAQQEQSELETKGNFEQQVVVLDFSALFLFDVDVLLSGGVEEFLKTAVPPTSSSIPIGPSATTTTTTPAAVAATTTTTTTSSLDLQQQDAQISFDSTNPFATTRSVRTLNIPHIPTTLGHINYVMNNAMGNVDWLQNIQSKLDVLKQKDHLHYLNTTTTTGSIGKKLNSALDSHRSSLLDGPLEEDTPTTTTHDKKRGGYTTGHPRGGAATSTTATTTSSSSSSITTSSSTATTTSSATTTAASSTTTTAATTSTTTSASTDHKDNHRGGARGGDRDRDMSRDNRDNRDARDNRDNNRDRDDRDNRDRDRDFHRDRGRGGDRGRDDHKDRDTRDRDFRDRDLRDRDRDLRDRDHGNHLDNRRDADRGRDHGKDDTNNSSLDNRGGGRRGGGNHDADSTPSGGGGRGGYSSYSKEDTYKKGNPDRERNRGYK